MLPMKLLRASVKPNSRAARVAPSGVHRPKIIAARAMYPSPEDMSLLNVPTDPIVRYAPPIPAPQPPAGAEQADLDRDDRDVGDVQEDRRVEEDRPDDGDVAQPGDLDRAER